MITSFYMTKTNSRNTEIRIKMTFFSLLFFFFVFKEHTFNHRILNIKRKLVIIEIPTGG